jgi:hypothetical protein
MFVFSGSVSQVAGALLHRAVVLKNERRGPASESKHQEAETERIGQTRRENAIRLTQLAVFLCGNQKNGKKRLDLPFENGDGSPRSLNDYVADVKLAREALITECEQSRAAGEDDQADALHSAIDYLLDCNPGAAGFIVSEEDRESLRQDLIVA